ncbi:hypothetical protein D6D28_02178 [Aureobasidium pullulans]|uniref:DUF6536 domain-containing protein n=1 Tax=Aureobasidium pullulans TaxID=5580 RepID=A0A4S8SUU2_AURPU|nr:hypothetical protein D6D28_02178 [Aureobasidium pullulans]
MDDGHERLISSGSGPRRHPTWRTVLIINTTFASFTLIAYIAFLIWIHSNTHVAHGVAEVFSGLCSEVSRAVAYAHLLVNAFAVLLFAVGTHGVQVLLSPTRAEVDTAHARERWLHIGVGGFRNMRWIHKRRLIRAVLLGLASIMLPFLHNSVFFTTLATTDRTVALVTEDYPKGSRLDGATEQSTFLAKAEIYVNISRSSRTALKSIEYEELLQQMRVNLVDLVRLPTEECRSIFSSSRVPFDYSNVLLISSSNASNSLDGFIDGDLQYPEMAVKSKDQSVQAIDWFNTFVVVSIFHNHCIDTDFDFGNSISTYPVEYCLAQKFEPDCGVSVNARVLPGILVCLFVEVFCLASLAFSRGFRPLTTVGDAVASFMKHPDTFSAKTPGVSVHSVHSPTSRFDKFGFRRSEKDIALWGRKWPVWRAAVDTETCALFLNCLFLGFFATATAVLITLQSSTSEHGLFANLFGLGSIHVVISITYLFYNHLFSRMFAAVELSSYSRTQAPLRVTLPRQGARNTYYLAMKPYYSLLLIVALVLVHFLTTQALNVVALTTYDVMGQYSHQRITYGISPSSAISALVVGFVMLCALAFALERKLDDGMPVLGTCSMAISAACHVDSGRATLGPVNYGKDEGTGKSGFMCREVSEF